MLIVGIAFLMAAAAAWLLLPSVAAIANRTGLVDKPDNTRKLHRKPIPLVGGIVVLIASIIAVAFTYSITSIHFRANDVVELWGLLVSAIVLVIVGVIDDRFGLRGRQKLLGQIAAVTILIIAGYQFTGIQLDAFSFKFSLEFGVFSAIVIYAWCLFAINSVNLLDGADGFATVIGIIASLAMSVMTYSYNMYTDAVICLALAGALTGFLRYNFPPAKAFLGDAGSMLIGLVLSAIAIRGSFKQATLYALFAPIAMLAIPFIDTVAAIIRRRFTGRSIYAEDRGHLHHVLAKRGLGPVASLIWVALLCTATAVGGTLTLLLRQSEYAIASIGLVLAVMIMGRLFGFAEYQLVYRKGLSLVRSVVALPKKERPAVLKTSIQLQGHRGWDNCWERLCDFAVDHNLNQITLDVNAPWMHEAFHADWKKAGTKNSPTQQWQVELPLILTNRILGRVTICADRENRISYHDAVVNLLKVTNDIEQSILEAEAAAIESGIISIAPGETQRTEVAPGDPDDQPRPMKASIR